MATVQSKFDQVDTHMNCSISLSLLLSLFLLFCGFFVAKSVGKGLAATPHTHVRDIVSRKRSLFQGRRPPTPRKCFAERTAWQRSLETCKRHTSRYDHAGSWSRHWPYPASVQGLEPAWGYPILRQCYYSCIAGAARQPPACGLAHVCCGPIAHDAQGSLLGGKVGFII